MEGKSLEVSYCLTHNPRKTFLIDLAIPGMYDFHFIVTENCAQRKEETLFKNLHLRPTNTTKMKKKINLLDHSKQNCWNLGLKR